MTIGEKLTELRKKKKLTQAAVAKEMGIPANSYSRWESGANKPGNASIKKLSDYFGEDLSGYKDKAAPATKKDKAAPAKNAKKGKAAAKKADKAVKEKADEAVKETSVVEMKTDESAPEKKTGKAASRRKTEKAASKRKTEEVAPEKADRAVKNTRTAAKEENRDVDYSAIELQYAGKAIPMSDIVSRAKEACGKKAGKLDIYIKPEENRVYYVCDGNVGSFEI